MVWHGGVMRYCPPGGAHTVLSLEICSARRIETVKNIAQLIRSRDRRIHADNGWPSMLQIPICVRIPKAAYQLEEITEVIYRSHDETYFQPIGELGYRICR